MAKNVTERFSDKVKDYILYRPGYPAVIVDFLKAECGLKTADRIADIGSGTGMLSDIFLKNGNTVYAVEPNDEMRRAAEEKYRGNPGFISINAKAEATGLPDVCVEFVSVGQAFHWFDQKKARSEFERILVPGGYVILVWNERDINLDGFMGAYDQFLLNHSTDYAEIDHRNVSMEMLNAFYWPGRFSINEFDNKQVLDFKGLKGRYDSCSYAIPNNDIRYEPSVNALKELFDFYQKDGKVEMLYKTRLYLGKFIP